MRGFELVNIDILKSNKEWLFQGNTLKGSDEYIAMEAIKLGYIVGDYSTQCKLVEDYVLANNPLFKMNLSSIQLDIMRTGLEIGRRLYEDDRGILI